MEAKTIYQVVEVNSSDTITSKDSFLCESEEIANDRLNELVARATKYIPSTVEEYKGRKHTDGEENGTWYTVERKKIVRIFNLNGEVCSTTYFGFISLNMLTK